MAALPPDERGRLQALRRLESIDAANTPALNRLTDFCAELFSAPVAVLAAVDAERVWFWSAHGLELREAPREGSFFDQTVLSEDVLVIDDARFAGAPLITRDGYAVGALCVLGAAPGAFDRGGSGLLRSLAGIATDCLEGARAEAQLRETQKMEAISRLAGGVAHGFNNLLTIVTGYAQLLKSGFRPEDPFHSYANEILGAADRAAALTNKLLAFSRRGFGQPRVIDLNALLTGMSASVRALLGESIELALVLDRGLVKVIGDSDQLELALSDLVRNARDAMPEGGKLTVRTANLALAEADLRGHPSLTPGAYALIEVEDNGVGMDEETKSHLFEPFFTTKGPGQGTGLAAVYGIVRQWGGEVTVASSQGSGTTVSILLPAAPG
jgi:signal transduction histidine kinase